MVYLILAILKINLTQDVSIVAKVCDLNGGRNMRLFRQACLWEGSDIYDPNPNLIVNSFERSCLIFPIGRPKCRCTAKRTISIAMNQPPWKTPYAVVYYFAAGRSIFDRPHPKAGHLRVLISYQLQPWNGLFSWRIISSDSFRRDPWGSATRLYIMRCGLGSLFILSKKRLSSRISMSD